MTLDNSSSKVQINQIDLFSGSLAIAGHPWYSITDYAYT